jgi:site-specific recombinase XerD
MPVLTLTNEVIETLICPPEKKHLEVFDDVLKGFYVDVLPSGRITYRIRYRHNAKKGLQSIGNARMMRVEDARNLALAAIQKIKQQNAANKQSSGLSGVTLNDFLAKQYLPYVQSYKRSWKSDVSMINTHIAPNLGQLVMCKVSAFDITNFIETMKHKNLAPGTINRALVLLRYAYKLAQRWQEPGVNLNAWLSIKQLKVDNRIERYLTPEQSANLLHQVKDSLNPQLVFIVAFLIYTGARKREVLEVKWSDINFDQSSWKISKNKSNKVRHIPLSEGALETLSAVREKWTCQHWGVRVDPDDFIFANPSTGKPYSSFFYSWDTARTKAGMPELRVHDLRHSFASFLVNAGRSIYEVQELLGHADIKTTSRYAHLSRESLKAAVSVVPKLNVAFKRDKPASSAA